MASAPTFVGPCPANTERENNMDIKNIPFGVTDWNDIEATEHLGETGIAYWRTKHFGPIRVRMVEYSE